MRAPTGLCNYHAVEICLEDRMTIKTTYAGEDIRHSPVRGVAFAILLSAFGLSSVSSAQDEGADAGNDEIRPIEVHEKQTASIAGGLDVSLRTPDGKEENALFQLRDTGPTTVFDVNRTDNLLTRSAGLSSLLRGTSGPAVVGNYSSLGVRLGANPADPASGFRMALTSALEFSEAGLPLAGERGMLDRSYDMGVRLGYWGFRIDASVVRKDSLVAGNYVGFGLGVGYSSSRFDTSISLKAFTEGEHLANVHEFDQEVQEFELGAAWRFTNRLSLAGTVNYTRFNNRILENQLGLSEQSVYLTGKLAF